MIQGHSRQALRRRLRKRYGDNCCWCGKPMLFGVAGFSPENASIEHVVPKWKGGADEEDNMMLAHLGCNHARNHEDQLRRQFAASIPRVCPNTTRHTVMTVWKDISTAPNDRVLVADERVENIAVCRLIGGKWMMGHMVYDEQVDFEPRWWMPRDYEGNPFKSPPPDNTDV